MVIARGQREYDRVLGDPTQMATEGFESFGYLAGYAFQRKTGAEYEYEVGIHSWAGCNKAGWMSEASARTRALQQTAGACSIVGS